MMEHDSLSIKGSCTSRANQYGIKGLPSFRVMERTFRSNPSNGTSLFTDYKKDDLYLHPT
jgi:hypothetical protein